MTRQKIKYRLSQHISKAKASIKKNRTQAWIVSCLNSDIKIEIDIIEENIDSIDLAISRESYFIKLYRGINGDLKNETEGGNCMNDGSYWRGRKQTKEHSDKISNSLKGRKPRPEEIKKSVDRMIDLVYEGNYPGAIKIDQYDLDMNFIKTWPSIRRIEAELGFGYRSIWYNVNNITKKSNGYIWKKSGM